jgi:DNA-binding NtrC family response regulator
MGGFREGGGDRDGSLEGRTVLFLDDDDDLRGMVAALFYAYHLGCVSAGSVAELKRLGSRALHVDVAVLDINLGAGQPSGLDAFRWLRANGYAGRVAFLTGHARTHPLVEAAHLIGDACVLEKPITTESLLALAERGEG